jgi:hypothetical protein
MLENLINAARTKSLEEFLKSYPTLNETLYEAVRKSKQGYISITKISDNIGSFLQKGDTYGGMTKAFGEGISCYISNLDDWYCTSIIQHINWENNTFTTLNSEYRFTLQELNTSKNND